MSKELLYEDLVDAAAVKRQITKYLSDYNNMVGVVPMDLVLFRDAIEHGNRDIFFFKHFFVFFSINTRFRFCNYFPTALKQN